MQQDLDQEYWKGKRLQEARESSAKNAVGILDIAERLGLLKGKYNSLEEFYTEFNGVCNQLCDKILENVKLEREQPQQKQSSEQQRNKVIRVEVTDSEDEKTINVKEELKDIGYRWDNQKKCWYKEYDDADFMHDELSHKDVLRVLTINQI